MAHIGVAVLPGIGQRADQEKHIPELATRRLMAAAVFIVAAIAAVVSFLHIEHLAASRGQGHLADMLLPISVDGASGGLVGVLVSAWPAVAFIGGIELLVWTARTARLSAPASAPQTASLSAPESTRSAASPSVSDGPR